MENSYVEPYLHLLKNSPVLCLALLTNSPSGPEEEWLGLLSPKELEEGRSRVSPTAWRNWLGGRLAAKAAAGNLLARPIDQVEILRGSKGPPELRQPADFVGGIFVSISHTEGAALAVAAYEPVGVDLEAQGRKFSDRAWIWAFTEEERALAQSPPHPAYPARMAMWCAKEAAAKSWGLPLLDHLAEVMVVWADWSEKRLRVQRFGSEPASALVELMEAEEFLLALAFARPAPADN